MDIVAPVLWLDITTVDISLAIDFKLPGGLLNLLTHVYSKTNVFCMKAWPVIVVQSAVVRRSRQGNEGDYGNCYLTQLAKILMCRNVFHSGFMTGEDGEVKCFRRIEPRTDENTVLLRGTLASDILEPLIPQKQFSS